MSDRTDPFQDIEKLFDQLTQFGTAAGSDVAVDVVDEGEEFAVVADLPGFASDDISVELEDEYKLAISADREESTTMGDGDYVRRERHEHSVGRTVRLPAPVDADSTDASYDNGVLTVRLGKATGDSAGTDIPVN